MVLENAVNISLRVSDPICTIFTLHDFVDFVGFSFSGTIMISAFLSHAVVHVANVPRSGNTFRCFTVRLESGFILRNPAFTYVWWESETSEKSAVVYKQFLKRWILIRKYLKGLSIQGYLLWSYSLVYVWHCFELILTSTLRAQVMPFGVLKKPK